MALPHAPLCDSKMKIPNICKVVAVWGVGMSGPSNWNGEGDREAHRSTPSFLGNLSCWITCQHILHIRYNLDKRALLALTSRFLVLLSKYSSLNLYFVLSSVPGSAFIKSPKIFYRPSSLSLSLSRKALGAGSSHSVEQTGCIVGGCIVGGCIVGGCIVGGWGAMSSEYHTMKPERLLTAEQGERWVLSMRVLLEHY